jgi:hypothetical protein
MQLKLEEVDNPLSLILYYAVGLLKIPPVVKRVGRRSEPIIDGKRRCTGCKRVKSIKLFSTRIKDGVRVPKPRCNHCENKYMQQLKERQINALAIFLAWVTVFLSN